MESVELTSIVFTYVKDGKLRAMTRVIAKESVEEIIHVVDRLSLT